MDLAPQSLLGLAHILREPGLVWITHNQQVDVALGVLLAFGE